jgi:hypothetical protein
MRSPSDLDRAGTAVLQKWHAWAAAVRSSGEVISVRSLIGAAGANE